MYGRFPKFHRSLINYGTSVEEVVRKMTGLAANRLGLTDRGWIEFGQMADITIFDPAEYRTEADDYDPFVAAKGVHVGIVNGENCEPTGVHASKILLKQHEI
ncbi:MAG: N-acyl-D-amino-acid deacylase [Gammaproteobacteria bacterium]